MRTIILVDVSNIYYSLRESMRARVRYDRLLDWAKQEGEVVAAIAFTPYHPDRPEQIAFLNALSIAGFRVHARPVRRGENLDGTEIPRGAGNIDVALAIEAIHLAPLADRLWLVSGDGDFAELVHFLAQQGKIIWVIAARVGLSTELARAAHQVVLLEDLDREVPGLLEREEQREEPEETVPSGPIEVLLRQIAQAMAELAREHPEGFSISLIGSRNRALAEQARSVGRLPALAALALLDGVLPGWAIVSEGSELVVRPGRSGASTEERLREMVLTGWSLIPPLSAARSVVEAVTALDPPAAGLRELEDRVLEHLGGKISRAQVELILSALRVAGAIRPGPDGLEWERDAGRLEDALGRARLERIRRRLAGESPAFQERALRCLGLLRTG